MTPTDQPSGTRRRVYHRPRMVPFLLTGGVIGLVVGFALAVFGPETPYASRGQEIMAMTVPGALLGGLIGAIIFLLVEKFSSRR